MNPLRKLSANISAATTAGRASTVVSSSGDGTAAGGDGDSQEPQFVFSMRFEDYELGNPIGLNNQSKTSYSAALPFWGSFSQSHVTGYGSSAVVHIAKYLPINKNVAVKVIELDIAGSLLDIMKTAYPHGIEEQCICSILRQALQGLEYLHQNGLIHRDVKAGNLLLADDGLVQLGDFGVSSSLMETGERKGPLRKTFVGTPCWMAPEVMEQTGYDYKADIWSFGITALEMATGHAPFAKYPPLKVGSDTCEKVFDPEIRPNATKLLQHAFFIQYAKKREHLAGDLLRALPPITKRAHTRSLVFRNIFKLIMIYPETLPQQEDDVRGASWDFSSEVGTPDATVCGMSSAIMSSLSALSSSNLNSSPANTSAATAAAEFKKGRFSVSESLSNCAPQAELQSLGILGGSDTAPVSIGGNPDSGADSSPSLSQVDSSSPKLSRFTVTDTQLRPCSPGNSEKRSRFEVHSLYGEADMALSPSTSLGRNALGTSRLASSVTAGKSDEGDESVERTTIRDGFGSGLGLAEENRALREENLTLRGVSQTGVEILKEAGHEIEYFTKALPEDQLKQKIKKVHAIGIRSKTQLTADVLKEAKNLVAIGCFCIGTNQVNLEYAATHGMTVFSSPFSNSRSVAELVLGEMIGLARQVTDRNTELHNGVWNRVNTALSHEIKGKQLGIIGYGHIGSQLSVIAEGFGMIVRYFDVNQVFPLGNALPLKSLEELLKTSDFVSLHVPETPETKNMIGTKELAFMKKGAYLINASRGTVVDIPALSSALKSGHLAGAAVDVFPVEPFANGKNFQSPLTGCANTILSPHIGGSTEEAQSAIGVEVATALSKFLATGMTLGSVNFPEVDLKPVAAKVVRIVNVHHNVPGVLKQVNRLLSSCNIGKQICDSKGSIAYLSADLEVASGTSIEEITKGITSMPENIMTRIIS
ncbi:hypothetical protein HDU84_001366 [Entophlyctis sp. JEL0112]|nr:hypothetical protein HDU84_001366 [Entophlyctis sp. JEL0112]